MQKKFKQSFNAIRTKNAIKSFTDQNLVWKFLLANRMISLLFILAALLMVTIGRIVPASATPGSEIIWAKSQECNFTIIDPTFSLDGATQGLESTTASCAWEASAKDTAWTITEFTSTRFDIVNDLQLSIVFSVTGWHAADNLLLQVSNNGGVDWTALDGFDSSNPPPAEIIPKTYDINQVAHTLAELQGVQIRLMVPGGGQPSPAFTVHLDSVFITVIGENSPTITPTQTVISLGIPTETLEPTPTITSTITPTIAISTPMLVETASIISSTITAAASPTVIFTPTSTPSPTVTPFPAVTLKPINNAQTQVLWGVEQSCTFDIKNPTLSLDQAFNDLAASCSGDFTGNQNAWQFTLFQHTTFTHLVDSIIEIRISVTGWVDDSFNLEFFNGTQWHVLAQFGAGKSIPPGSLMTLGYRIDNLLTSPEQVNQAALRLVGSSVNNDPDNLMIAIDEARLSVAGGTAGQAAFEPMPLTSFSPMALLDAAAGSPHRDQSMLTDSCSACHYSHAASGPELRETWPEEASCFSCHGSNGPGTNVQLAFVNYINTSTRFFTHDVMYTNNIHHLGQTGGADFGGGNRHVECEDCHDPHYAGGGSASAPNLPPQMAGVSGVNPLWIGAGSPSSYDWQADASGEYQVCFKCHSSFTNLPTYQPDGWNGIAFIANGLRKLTSTLASQVLDSRDMAKEFNPAQASFHPVAAIGRNQNIPANSFVNGWSQSSMVYCTDCHSNPAATAGDSGAHGSPQLHLLNGTSNYSTVIRISSQPVPTSGEVCFQCHNYQTYVTGQDQSTNFVHHAKHMNNDLGVTCYTCHDSHGSEQQHLINMDASMMTFLNGRNSQTSWYYDPTTQRAGCFVSCHGETHNPKEYTP